MSGNRSEENSICAKGINLHGSITVRFVLAAVLFVLSIVLQNIFHSSIVLVASLTVLYLAYLCIADVTLSRKLIGPLNQLMEMVHQLRLGHLNVHASLHSYTDLETFAHELNMTMDSLSRMIEQISGLLWSIAEKNLDIEPVENYPGDFVALSQAMNTIIDNFNTLVYNITASSEEVASGSKQVAEGDQNLSNGATQQASSVEQLTASITEITKQIKQSFVNALKANQLAAAARESALLGARQMGEMLQAINEINDSTRHISKVIKVVNDIAFQINILALNAAVEAARAGQYGKGFAVVAKEIRSLAARSANAVKETTDLIESSISKTGSGFKIANETASVFSEIEKNVNSVATLVAEIALATKEQDTGTAQISKGVEIISNVVQTNSATAEQSAASSEELSSQAENLKELMDEFIIRTLRC